MFISRIAQRIYERYPGTVLGVFVALLPWVVWGAVQALGTNNNNIRQWLPQEYEESQTYDWFRQHFPPDEFALVSWDGCTLSDERLAQFADLVVPDSQAAEPASGQDDREADERLFSRVRTGPELLLTLTGPPFRLDRERAINRLVGWVIGRDRQTTCALVTLSAAGNADRGAVLRRLQHIATEQVGIPEDELHLVGEPIFNARVDAASEQAIGQLPVWSAMTAAVIALLSLRSVKLTVAVFAAAMYSGALAQAMLYYLGGNLNLVLVVMPILVYVLSLSAAVHLVNYYRDAKAERGSASPANEAIRRGFAPCTLAAVTTAVGLASLAVSHILPVRDFGLYSALGILASLVVLFLPLPALLSILTRRQRQPDSQPSPPTSSGAVERGWSSRAAHGILAGRGYLALACGALLVGAAAGIPALETTVNPVRFFPEESRLRQDYAWVEERFGPVVPVEMVVAFDETENSLSMLDRLKLVKEIQQQVAGMQQINATMSAATFVPPLPREEQADAAGDGGVGGILGALGRSFGASPERIERFAFNRQLQEHRQAFIEQGYLSREEQRQLWRISARAAGRDAVDQAGFLDSIQSEVNAYLEDRPSRWTAGVSVYYTGMVPLFYLAQRELLDGLFKSFLLAFVLIAVLMVMVLRSAGGGLLAMLPNVFPAAVVFGMMGHLRLPVDIGSMLTASAAMGIAVDDTVHFLTWMRRGFDQGMSRYDAVTYGWRRCSGAMLQTTAIAGLGLAVYGTSSFQPVSQFGLLIFLLLVVTLIGDLVFLPALAAGPAGKLLESGGGRGRARRSSSDE